MRIKTQTKVVVENINWKLDLEEEEIKISIKQAGFEAPLSVSTGGVFLVFALKQV